MTSNSHEFLLCIQLLISGFKDICLTFLIPQIQEYTIYLEYSYPQYMLSSQLSLYGDIGSQGVRSVMTVLEMGRVPYRRQPIDVYKLENKSQQYLKINPFGQVPAIVDGDFKLSESGAIMIYLYETRPAVPKTLYGSSVQERARINQYMSWYQNQFRPILFDPIFLRIRYLITNNDEMFTVALLQNADKRIYVTLKLLDKLLKDGGHKYLCSDKLSFADIMFYYQFSNTIIYEKHWPKLTHLNEWAKRVGEVPEIKAIMDQWYKGIDQKRDMIRNIIPKQPGRL